MKIRVKFYRAEHDGHLIDDVISGYTKIFNWNTEPYSHCGIWWPDADGRFLNEGSDGVGLFFTGFAGVCFSSTMRGDANGTVIRPARDVLTHPERWDYCEIEVPDEKALEAMAWAQVEALNNKGYDKLQILGFFFPWRFGRADQNICTEAVGKFLYQALVLDRIWVWSPRRLSAKLIEKGYKIVPLI